MDSATTPFAPPRTHIRFDERGRPWIEGTNLKVIELALDVVANGWGPAEIFENRGRRIPLAKIHAALAYYYDNQAAFDAEMQRQLREAERLREEAGETPFEKRMRASGMLP